MLADQSKQPANQLQSRAYRATRALIRGRFDEVEALIGEVIELGVLAQSPGALHYSSVELVVLRWEQGTLEELEQPLRELKERTGAAIWRAALALLCSEIDEAEWAHTELETLMADRCAAVPFDENWLATLAFLGMTCANFGDTKRAAELHGTARALPRPLHRHRRRRRLPWAGFAFPRLAGHRRRRLAGGAGAARAGERGESGGRLRAVAGARTLPTRPGAPRPGEPRRPGASPAS